MNKRQKFILFIFGALIAVSITFAPHNADGTGDVIFRMLGTKTEIPFSSNSRERAKIEEIKNSVAKSHPEAFKGLTLNQFSRRMAEYAETDPEMAGLDYRAGFFGWPVPNYAMLTGFWVIAAIFTAIGLVTCKDKK
jgi:hypothetical protein